MINNIITFCDIFNLFSTLTVKDLPKPSITSGLSATGGGGDVSEIDQFPDGPIGGAFDVYSQLKSSQSGGGGELS